MQLPVCDSVQTEQVNVGGGLHQIPVRMEVLDLLVSLEMVYFIQLKKSRQPAFSRAPAFGGQTDGTPITYVYQQYLLWLEC